MTDLSHWDFAENFSVFDVAALILGCEPNQAWRHELKVQIVADRMKLHYGYATKRAFNDNFGDPLENIERDERIFAELPSVDLKALSFRAFRFDDGVPLGRWLDCEDQSNFVNQKFNRYSIVDWLADVGFKSVYQFDLRQPIAGGVMVEIMVSKETMKTDIDPADLPEELHAANIAFRAVTNGHGDPSATFRNRLIGYLETNFLGLSNDAVRRIATVANPDKTTGRQKSNT